MDVDLADDLSCQADMRQYGRDRRHVSDVSVHLRPPCNPTPCDHPVQRRFVITISSITDGRGTSQWLMITLRFKALGYHSWYMLVSHTIPCASDAIADLHVAYHSDVCIRFSTDSLDLCGVHLAAQGDWLQEWTKAIPEDPANSSKGQRGQCTRR